MNIRSRIVAAAAIMVLVAGASVTQAGSTLHRLHGPVSGLSNTVPALQLVHRWHGKWHRQPVKRLNLTANQVRRILRNRGFRHIRFTDRSGRIYRAYARTRRGHRVRLVISSRNARILRQEPIYAIF